MENVNNNFYNEDIKNRFLETIQSPIAKASAILIFKKSGEPTEGVETVYEKDIFDMTIEELEEVASSLSCSTTNAVYNNVIKLEEYIDWAIESGLRKNNLNPLSNIDKVKWSEKFVATYRNYYFTREKIEDMMDELVNNADKALLLALFEGIKGKGFSEIFNLEAKDITEDNGIYTVHLKEDDGSERDLQISELLAITLKRANKEVAYYNKNGENKNEKFATSPFEDSKYIFKKTARGKQKDDKLTFTFITRKFLLFKEVFDMEFLKAKHITDSGIMHYADQLQVDETISSNQMNEIAERFDTPYTHATGGIKYRNNTLIKKIIQIPDFEELYGYKMKFTLDRIQS